MWQEGLLWFMIGFNYLCLAHSPSYKPTSTSERQSTALDGANQLGVGQDEIFAPDRAVGSHAAVQGNNASVLDLGPGIDISHEASL